MSRSRNRGNVGCRGGAKCAKTTIPIQRFRYSGARVRVKDDPERGGGGTVDGVLVKATWLMHVTWTTGGCSALAWSELELERE